MKVYAVLFRWEDIHELEGIFLTKPSALNYIYNQALERGLHTPDDIWIEKREVSEEVKRYSKEDTDALVKGWGCDSEEEKKEFLENLKSELLDL